MKNKTSIFKFDIDTKSRLKELSNVIGMPMVTLLAFMIHRSYKAVIEENKSFFDTNK